MNLVYVAPKLKNAKLRFRLKLHFHGSLATKFLYVKTFIYEVVRHSLAHLYVQKWLVETSP